MIGLMILYTTTDEQNLITMCMITYYLTFGYDIVQMLVSGIKFDRLLVSRSLLHVGLIAMVWWFCQNIMKRWHEALFRSDKEIKELKEATERMDDFMVNISHEIRTPMNAVVGLSSVMIKNTKSAKHREGLIKILDAGHRVSAQVGDILDHTEIDMGKLSVNKEPYMLSSVISDLIAQVKPIIPPSLDLVIDVDPDVPGTIKGDAEKIKKILWHLVTNGLKFTKDGGVYVYITCAKKEYGINLQIEVKDTGIGMTEDEIDRIFERFYQTDSGRTRATGGLGLGINIVQGFVKAMGGFLSISSEEGVGTRAMVAIPQQVIDEEPCIRITQPETLCMVGLIDFANIIHPTVREYYLQLARHLSERLKIPFYWSDSIDHLKKMMGVYRISHILAGKKMYEENKEYLISLTKEIEVSVFVEDNYPGEPQNPVHFLRKPVSPFSVMGLKHSTQISLVHEDLQMTCPGIRAMVVDDEPMNLFVANDILSGYGMMVDTVESGAECIHNYEMRDYDIIFMDHMMPEMDGIEAMRRIKNIKKKSGKDAVVVALTANAVSTAREMFLNVGFDGFVPKTIEIYDLERVLKNVLPESAIVYIEADDLSAKEAEGKPKKVETEPLASKEETASAETDRYATIRGAGVDPKEGLKYCRGDEDFYQSVLREYVKGAFQKREKLKKAFENDDYVNYAIHIHAIKSTSKMIGAMALFEEAKTLEEAANASDSTKIRNEHASVMKQYVDVVEAIRQMFGEDGSDEKVMKEKLSEEASEEVMEFFADEDEVLEFAPESE